MRIEHTVEVDAPLERVWALVNDIPRVAPCMPGAALTGVVDDKTYEGTVAVKLGPLRMSYKGKVVVEEIDEANHSARLAATGKDTKGAGTARASVETRMEPAGDHHTRLMVTSDVQLTGKVASFGRGGAINDVASRLFGQFADCLRATLEAEQVEAQAAAAPSTGTAPGTPAPTGTTAAEPAMGSGAASATAAPPELGPPELGPPELDPPELDPPELGPAVSQPAAPAPRPAASPPRAAEALDAGSLAGTVIKGRLQALFQAIAGFFRRLFSRRSRG